MESLEIETSLERIAALAEPMWADNWNFRSYLKSEVPSEEVDRVAKPVVARITAQIDCTACANCCRTISPVMDDEEVVEVAAAAAMSLEDLMSKTEVTDEGGRSFCIKPCPLLKENKCSVYNARPSDCREYPHLDKENFLAGSIGFIENYGTCPIIFNVYNELKSQFSYRPDIDYIGDLDPEKGY